MGLHVVVVVGVVVGVGVLFVLVLVLVIVFVVIVIVIGVILDMVAGSCLSLLFLVLVYHCYSWFLV